MDNDNLYLFEQNGERLLEYSLVNKSSRYFELKCNIFSCGNWTICAVYNHMIWAFPSYANKVIKIDLEKGKIEENEKLCPDINYNFNQEDEFLISYGKEIGFPYKLYSSGCRIDNEIWLFAERKHFILKYDLSKDIYEKYSFPVTIGSCVWALHRNGIFYILTIEGNIYSWDFLNNRVELLVETENRYPYYSKFVITDTNIWLIPLFGADIYLIDLKSKRKSIYTDYPKDFSYYIDAARSKYSEYTEDEDNYYFAMHCANYLLIIEKKTGVGHWIKPIEPELSEKAAYYIKSRGIYFHEFFWDLKDWIRICAGKSKIYEISENIGNTIWTAMEK